MSQAPSLDFGPEWMRPSTTQSSSDKPVPWSGIASGNTTRHNNSNNTHRHHNQHHPRQQPFEQNSSDAKPTPINTDLPAQPVMSNADGKKYTPEEMIDIWQQMNGNNQLKPSGRARSEMYYSVLPNQPANVAFEHKEPAQGESTKEAKEDSPVLKSNLGGFLDHNTNGSSLAPGSKIAMPPTSNAWGVPSRPGLAQSGSNSDITGLGSKPSLLDGPPPGLNAGSTPPPPPPGMSLVSPDNIQWMYQDPTGKEYGPFTGRMMHEWYLGGWLQESLMIRRAEESEYSTLKSFKDRINNPPEPFLVPLPSIGGSSNSMGSSPVDPFAARFRQPAAAPLSSQFAGLQMQAPQSPWSTGPISPWGAPGAQPQSHLFPQPSQQPQSSLFGFGGPQFAQQPWGVGNMGGVPTTTTGAPPFNQNPMAASFEEKVAEPAPIGSPQVRSRTSTPNPEKQQQHHHHQPQQNSPIQSPAPIAQPSVSPSPETQAPSKPSPVAKPLPVESAKEKKPSASSSPAAASPVAQTSAPAHSPAAEDGEEDKPVEEAPKPKQPPPLAPWAKKVEAAPVKKPSAPSLKEIQEREAAERKNRLAHQQQQQQAQLLQQAAALQTSSATSPTLPSGATWGSPGAAASAPTKTLAQIQQEEAAAAAAAKKSGQAPPTASSPSIASTIKSAAAGSSPSSSVTPGVGHVRPPAGASNTNAWTQVGPGGRKIGKPAAASPTPAPAPAAAATPTPTVAAAAAATTPVKRAPAANASAAPKLPQPGSAPALNKSSEDFLNWCKSSMTDINPGVNTTEMLSMLLSLPATTDSKELVAETIYASSSTMDGRRFADEFIKRRKQADKEAPSMGDSWSDALKRQQTTDKGGNEGWHTSFKVVTKKKNKKT